NLARVAALEAGVPKSVPAFTVHRNCASGIESIAEASYKMEAGVASAIVAGGAESMSNYPLMMGPALTEAFAASARGRTPLAQLPAFLPLEGARLPPGTPSSRGTAR